MHRREVVEEVRSARGNGLTLAQLERKLAGSWGRDLVRDELPALLAEAEERGELVRGKGRVVALEYTDFYVGEIRLTSRGLGIVRQGERDLPDIVVPPEKLATAMDGDQVLAHLGARRKQGRLIPDKNGEVVRVLRRRRPTLVGRYVPDPVRPWVDPYARRVNMRVLLDPVPDPAPRAGEFVEVVLRGIPEEGPVEGTLVRALGVPGESGVDEEVVLAELAIPVEFPPEALLESDALPMGVLPDDLAGRTDRRGQPAVTIDGETARDFDDAVVALEAADGAIEVFVHIADVSHYVRPGSAIDSAARERGTSVYLPGRCVPMLPEKLSNHLCSLVPGAGPAGVLSSLPRQPGWGGGGLPGRAVGVSARAGGARTRRFSTGWSGARGPLTCPRGCGAPWSCSTRRPGAWAGAGRSAGRSTSTYRNRRSCLTRKGS